MIIEILTIIDLSMSFILRVVIMILTGANLKAILISSRRRQQPNLAEPSDNARHR